MAATHKTLFILAHAALEWILILMLLLNSFFSYLIRKFAAYYVLEPPCVWCSVIDHLLEPNKNINAYQNLICERHAAEFLSLYQCPDHQIVTTDPRCSYCSINFQAESCDRSFKGASRLKSNYDENEMVEVMEFPVENMSGHIQVFDQIIPLEWTDSSTTCSRNTSLNGDENMVVNDEAQIKKQEGRFLQSSSCQDEEEKEGKDVRFDSLMEELKAERLAVCGLYIELDEERNASAIAAKEAMAMITRLQEEKVALQIEFTQNQRMMDEQAEYDQEVLQLLNELVMKLENDKLELENELEIYKERLLDYEGEKKPKMMPRCPSASSCRITKESLDETNVSDLKNLRTLEESLVGFAVERLWTLNELKELDETLMTLKHDIDEDQVRKANLKGEDLDYKENRLLHFLDIEGIVEEAEASHSEWIRSSF